MIIDRGDIISALWSIYFHCIILTERNADPTANTNVINVFSNGDLLNFLINVTLLIFLVLE